MTIEGTTTFANNTASGFGGEILSNEEISPINIAVESMSVLFLGHSGDRMAV